MKTTRERGRPARTRLGTASPTSPTSINRNGVVPGPLCKGCSRFDHSPLEREVQPHLGARAFAQLHLSPPLHCHSPLEGESQKPSRQAMADAVGGWTPARQRRAATPDRFSTVLIY